MLKILFLLSLIFAIYWMLRVKNRYVFMMTSGLVLAGLLVLFAPGDFHEYGIHLYLISAAAVVVYGVISKQRTLEQRLVISLAALATITHWVWVSNHWHGNTLLLAILILLIGAYALIRRIRLKNELGILIIFMVDASVILLEAWLKSAA
jgi:hypothetical protein